MAWTQTDLDRIEAAISNNVRTVTYADGRAVTYQDADKMLQVRNAMKAEITADATRVNRQVRATRGTMRRP
jgi:phage baseplate assembly protein gpV